MRDQAFKLRELFQSAEAPEVPKSVAPPIIAVFGGRSGVGATTIAVNLAAVLADRGEIVVVVDSAASHANLAEVACIRPPIEYYVDDVASGNCSARKALIAGPAGTLLLAARGVSRLRRRAGKHIESSSSPPNENQFSRNEQQRLLRELQSLNGEASLLVVDMGSGLTPWARRIWLRASLVLLVTTPDEAAVVDGYAVMKCAVGDKLRANVRVLVNQCANDKVAADTCRRFSAACQRFLARTVPALPAVPRHAIEQAHDAADVRSAPRVWESPNSPFGHAMLWLGRAVADVLQLADKADGRSPMVYEHMLHEIS